MYLVHVYGHQNSGKPASNLKLLASLNIILDALAKHIMAAFILPPVIKNKIAIGISDPHGIPSVSIHGSPVHSNISLYIAYKISKFRLLGRSE